MNDVTALRAKAEKCRRLARESSDQKTVEALTAMAAELEAEVAAESGEPVPLEPPLIPRIG